MFRSTNYHTAQEDSLTSKSFWGTASKIWILNWNGYYIVDVYRNSLPKPPTYKIIYQKTLRATAFVFCISRVTNGFLIYLSVRSFMKSRIIFNKLNVIGILFDTRCSKWNFFYLNFNKINNHFWEKIDVSASPELISSEYFLVRVRSPIKQLRLSI